MTNTDIRVIATDGKRLKEILYVNHRGNEIAYNYRHIHESGKEHITYHQDGYVHRKRESPNNGIVREPIVWGPPLDDFKGFYGADIFSTRKRSGSIFSWGDSNPDFDFSQKDSIVYIDIRNSERQINVRPYLLEVGKPFTDVLDHPGTEPENPNIQYQVITKTDPWVAIVYYSIEEIGGYLQPHSKEFVGIDENKEAYPGGEARLRDYKEKNTSEKS